MTINSLVSGLRVLGFKTPSFRSRGGCVRADTNDTLSERPNVRVRAVPANMCPARESDIGGRETPGAPFLGGTHSLGAQRTGTKKELKNFLYVLFFVRFQRAQRSRLEVLTQSTKRKTARSLVRLRRTALTKRGPLGKKE